MAFQGQLTPHAVAGLLFVPELGVDYGTTYRGVEMAWAFVVLLGDGSVQTQPLGGPDHRPRMHNSGRWWTTDNDTVSTDDPRLRTRLVLRDISLGGSNSGRRHNFDLLPVFCLVREQLVQGQLVWPGGINGCGIMMDYSQDAMWIPLQILCNLSALTAS
jgi:hypothetical protein